MKVFSWMLTSFLMLLILVVLAFMASPFALILAVYFGVFSYLSFRSSWKDRTDAMKKVLYSGIVLTVLMILESLLLGSLATPAGMASLFATPGILYVIAVGALFFGVPALISWLDGLTPPHTSGLRRNPFLLLVYILLSVGLYEFYWLWVIKKGLLKSEIQTISLAWVLLPLVGIFIVCWSVSKGLEKKTKTDFWLWFIIFFIFSGLDVVINQSILNSKLK